MRRTRKQARRSRRTRKHRGGYDPTRARARIASLQQKLGNASKKVTGIKEELAAAAAAETHGTQTPITVLNLPTEAEAAPSTVKASTFVAKNNAPVSFSPQRPTSPFGKPQTRMAKISPPAAQKELPGSSNASLPPSARAPPPPPPPAPEPEEEEEEEEKRPKHRPLERQEGKRYLQKPEHIRFSNLEEEGPVADPTVFGTNIGSENENWEPSSNLMESRKPIRPTKYTKEKQAKIYQPLSEREAQVFAEVTRNANTAKNMIKALEKYNLPSNSAFLIKRKIQGVYGEND